MDLVLNILLSIVPFFLMLMYYLIIFIPLIILIVIRKRRGKKILWYEYLLSFVFGLVLWYSLALLLSKIPIVRY